MVSIKALSVGCLEKSSAATLIGPQIQSRKTKSVLCAVARVFQHLGYIDTARDKNAATTPGAIAKSTWWAGVKSGRYPRPVRIGPRMVAWRSKDISALIQNGISERESA